jgi:hypothetical protein
MRFVESTTRLKAAKAELPGDPQSAVGCQRAVEQFLLWVKHLHFHALENIFAVIRTFDLPGQAPSGVVPGESGAASLTLKAGGRESIIFHKGKAGVFSASVTFILRQLGSKAFVV